MHAAGDPVVEPLGVGGFPRSGDSQRMKTDSAGLAEEISCYGIFRVVSSGYHRLIHAKILPETGAVWRRGKSKLTGLSEVQGDSGRNPPLLTTLLGMLRLQHWIKGLFILLPLPFAIAAGGSVDPSNLILGVLGFSLLSSGVYIFNDIQDRRRDRIHPDKRHRAVASGRVSLKLALIWGSLVTLLGLTLLAIPGVLLPYSPEPWLLGLAYLLGNAVYSFWARSVAWVDVLFLASFFLMRLILGCSLALVSASDMLLVTGFLLALTLSLGKRFSELSRGLTPDYRPSLAGYQETSLVWTLGISIMACWFTYLWYCYRSELLSDFMGWAGSGVVGLGLLLFFYEMVYTKSGRDPVEVVLKSTWPRWVVPLWLLTVWLSLFGK